jgi:integrase
MPKYKRGPNKYCVRIYLSGKPKDWIVHGTAAEADRFEARKRLELAATAQSEHRTAPTFSQFCAAEYKLHAEQQLGAATWANRQYTLATLSEYFGDTKLDAFSPTLIAEYRRERLELVGATKVNDEVRHLGTVLRYAVGIGVPAVVPKLKKLPEPKTTGRVRVWSAAEVAKLYAAIQAECPRLLGLAVVLVNTGMRKGEVLALEWSWVDVQRGLIFIQPNAYWRPKSNKPREVPLGSALRPWLDVPAAHREHAKYVFCTRRKKQTGALWSADRYVTWPQNQFDRAIATAGIGGSPHVARHTFASHFLRAVPDLFLLAQVLGHSHTRVTEIYSHLLPDHLAKARDAVNIPAPLASLPRHGSDMESRSKNRK